jgi:hypothetical protein
MRGPKHVRAGIGLEFFVDKVVARTVAAAAIGRRRASVWHVGQVRRTSSAPPTVARYHGKARDHRPWNEVLLQVVRHVAIVGALMAMAAALATRI